MTRGWVVNMHQWLVTQSYTKCLHINYTQLQEIRFSAQTLEALHISPAMIGVFLRVNHRLLNAETLMIVIRFKIFLHFNSFIDGFSLSVESWEKAQDIKMWEKVMLISAAVIKITFMGIIISSLNYFIPYWKYLVIKGFDTIWVLNNWPLLRNYISIIWIALSIIFN